MRLYLVQKVAGAVARYNNKVNGVSREFLCAFNHAVNRRVLIIEEMSCAAGNMRVIINDGSDVLPVFFCPAHV